MYKCGETSDGNLNERDNVMHFELFLWALFDAICREFSHSAFCLVSFYEMAFM